MCYQMKLVLWYFLLWSWSSNVVNSLTESTTTAIIVTPPMNITLARTTMEPKKFVLDNETKNILLESVVTTINGFCDMNEERRFYYRIASVNPTGLRRIMNTTDLSKVCSRFTGFVCEKYYNGTVNRLQDRCLCQLNYYWDKSINRCVQERGTACGTWTLQRLTFDVRHKFLNLNGNRTCPPNTSCSPRGLCLCKRGKVCQNNTGTVREINEKKNFKIWQKFVQGRRVAEYFLEPGATCNPKYEFPFYRLGGEPGRGFDYPKLRAHIMGIPATDHGTRRLFCNVLEFFQCRRHLCMCQIGYLVGDSGNGYECFAKKEMSCDVHAWFDVNWYDVQFNSCLESNDTCIEANDQQNFICCPARIIPETTKRCIFARVGRTVDVKYLFYLITFNMVVIFIKYFTN